MASVYGSGLLCFLFVLPRESKAQEAANKVKPGQSGKLELARSVARRRVSGIASLFDGKPWAGATITFYSRLHPQNTDPAYTDMLQVKSDERGRFRAKLLPGRAYTAWCNGESAEDGSYLSSRIEEKIFPRSSFRLRGHEKRNRLRKLVLEHREDWKEHEPLTVEAQLLASNRLRILLEPDKDGHFVLPKIGGTKCRLLVFGKDELPILSRIVSAGAEPKDKDPAELTVELPRPSGMLVRAVYNPDGQANAGIGPARRAKGAKKGDDAGKPLAGVMISRQVASTNKNWYPLGKTDKDGYCVLVVPVKRGKGGGSHMTIKASAAGYSSNTVYHSNFRPPKERDIAKLRAAEKPDLQLCLMDGYKIKGRILGADGSPVRGMPLFLYYSTANSHNSWTHYSEPAIFTTKEDGSFELHGVHVSCGFRLTAVIDSANLAALSKGSAFPLHPIAVLAVSAGSGDSKKDLDLGEIRLARLERLEIKVETADGQPVAKPQLLLGEPTMYIDGKMGPYHPFQFFAGRRGRISILVSKSKDMVLLAASAGGCKIMSLEFNDRAGSKYKGSVRSLNFVLGDGVRIRGVVTDAAGHKVARANISYYRRSQSRKPGSRLLDFVKAFASAKSDANGRFEFFVPPNCSYSVSASIRIDGKYYRTRRDQQLSVDSPDSTPEELELQLDIPKKSGR